MSERPYHHGNLREALLDGAEATLVDRGLVTVSLRELARKVGVSHAAPHRHFASRQELLDGLAVRGFQQLEAVLAQATTSAASFEQRVINAAQAYVDFALARGPLLDLMFASKRSDAPEAVRDAGHRSLVVMHALIEEGQRLGMVKAGDPAELSLPLIVAAQGLGSLIKTSLLNGDPQDQVEQLITIVLRGLRP